MWATAFALGMFYGMLFEAIQNQKRYKNQENMKRIIALCGGKEAK